MVSQDLTKKDVGRDLETMGHWDGGQLKGLERLTETDVMGTDKWLAQRGLSPTKASEGTAWNGYRGSLDWLKAADPPRNSYGQTAKRASYGMNDTDTKVWFAAVPL